MPTATSGFPDEPARLEAEGPHLKVSLGLGPNGALVAERSLSALIDTGASHSVIDGELAEQMGLPQIGVGKFAGVSGQDEGFKYLATVAVPELNWVDQGVFLGVPLAEGQFDYRVLLGRNFLRHFALVYEGRNGVVIVSDDVDELRLS